MIKVCGICSSPVSLHMYLTTLCKNNQAIEELLILFTFIIILYVLMCPDACVQVHVLVRGQVCRAGSLFTSLSDSRDQIQVIRLKQ